MDKQLIIPVKAIYKNDTVNVKMDYKIEKGFQTSKGYYKDTSHSQCCSNHDSNKL